MSVQGQLWHLNIMCIWAVTLEWYMYLSCDAWMSRVSELWHLNVMLYLSCDSWMLHVSELWPESYVYVSCDTWMIRVSELWLECYVYLSYNLNVMCMWAVTLECYVSQSCDLNVTCIWAVVGSANHHWKIQFEHFIDCGILYTACWNTPSQNGHFVNTQSMCVNNVRCLLILSLIHCFL